mgnify:CR=1 FL=1
MSLLEEIQEEMKSYTYAHYFKLAEIEAEITRMRDALYAIALTKHFGDCHPECDCLGEITDLARAALPEPPRV